MKNVYLSEFNWWQRALSKLTTMYRINADSVDFKWGYFSPRFGLEFIINRGGYFDTSYSVRFALIWGVFNIKLPFKTNLGEGCDMPRYGFLIHGTSLMFYTGGEFDKSWGQVQGGCHIWDLPFISYVFERYCIKDKLDNWVDMDKVDYWDFKKDEAKSQEFSYVYKLRSGETQRVTATVIEDYRQWHRKWLPFFKMRKDCIDVEFSDEVGERSGSYKGGCTGCGYDLLPSETAEKCLRRMEAERVFD